MIWHVADQLYTYLSRRSFCFFRCKFSFCSLACSDFRTSICVLCTIPLPPPQVRGIWDCWGASFSSTTRKQFHMDARIIWTMLKAKSIYFLAYCFLWSYMQNLTRFQVPLQQLFFFIHKHTSQYSHCQGDIKKHKRFFTEPFRVKIVIVSGMS